MEIEIIGIIIKNGKIIKIQINIIEIGIEMLQYLFEEFFRKVKNLKIDNAEK